MAKINGFLRAMVTVKQNVKKHVKTIRTAIIFPYQRMGSVTCPNFVVSNQEQDGQDMKEVKIIMIVKTRLLIFHKNGK